MSHCQNIYHPTPDCCECCNDAGHLEAERDRCNERLEVCVMTLKKTEEEVNRLREELEKVKADNENAVWNLAGCSTFALGYGIDKPYAEDLARPAMKDVLTLRKKYDKLRSLAEKMAEALNKIVCNIADMSSSKDFDRGNLKTYLDNTYTVGKEALDVYREWRYKEYPDKDGEWKEGNR